ncbi:MAG: response regulator [candidate division Zixibacteria bacterium]|nr:response regulator [candidate division Zixibacteria bacterium]
MTLPLIQIFFSLILLLLWFFLVNLKEKYLELNLKGWGEMSLGVFLIFLGSLLELGENIPELEKYFFVGNTSWGELSKIALYVVGIVLVSYSPLNWLPSILEARKKFKKENLKATEISSFLAELDKSSSQVENKDKIISILDFTLAYLSKELKADSGAVFLIPPTDKELILVQSLGLSDETLENLKNTRVDSKIFSLCLKDKRIETAGELLNSDQKLAILLKEDNIESGICIPLISEEKISGVVALFSRVKYHFDDFEPEPYYELSRALAGRIQNLREIETLEQKEKKLKIAGEKEKFLRLIAEDLSKGRLEEVLSHIVKACSEIFHPCNCRIYLREGDSLSLKASSSEVLQEEIHSSINDWFKEGSGNGELRLLNEGQNQEFKDRNGKKVFAVPLGNGKEPTGVIILECETNHDSFSPSEQDFIRTLAFQATEALKSSSLSKALEHKENLISSILDSVEDRITIYDKELRVIKINKAGLRFLNLSEEEVVGRSCFEIIYPQSQPEACPCYLSLKEKKPCFQQIKLSKEKSGRKGFLKVWAYPLLDEKGEVELVVEYAKFEEAQEPVSILDTGKKEVPKEFFNDLNNILAGILGNAELIMFQLKPYKDFATDMVAEQISTIEELVIKGSKLIREVKGEIEEVPEKKQTTTRETITEEKKKKEERLNILAIDDQKIIRDLLENILQGLGHDIKVASSGKEGLALFQQDGFDLVITDLGMPEMSGWEVSQRIKEMRKETPVVMITGWGVSFDAEKIREFGVDYLLPKPFKVEQLSKLIEQIRDEKLKNKIEKSE